MTDTLFPDAAPAPHQTWANRNTPNRRDDPATSRAAARVATGRTGTIRKAVFDALALGPLTDWELVEKVAGSDSGIRTRRSELVDEGLVIDSGERRLTGNGSMAIVWKLA